MIQGSNTVQLRPPERKIIVFHRREILHARLLCSSCKMYDSYLNQMIQYCTKLADPRFVIYWGTSISFSLSPRNILTEWTTESEAHFLVGNRWVTGRIWSRRRLQRSRGRRGMRRTCFCQDWRETRSIWSQLKALTASVMGHQAQLSGSDPRKMVSAGLTHLWRTNRYKYKNQNYQQKHLHFVCFFIHFFFKVLVSMLSIATGLQLFKDIISRLNNYANSF